MSARLRFRVTNVRGAYQNPIDERKQFYVRALRHACFTAHLSPCMIETIRMATKETSNEMPQLRGRRNDRRTYRCPRYNVGFFVFGTSYQHLFFQYSWKSFQLVKERVVLRSGYTRRAHECPSCKTIVIPPE